MNKVDLVVMLMS